MAFGKKRAALAFCSLVIAAVSAAILLQAPPGARAQAYHGMTMTPGDQAAVVQALKAVKKDQWAKAKELIAGTRDPLAAKLYYWLYYTNEPGPIQFNRISSFVRQNPQWPRQEMMRRTAEAKMTDALSDAEIVRWFNEYEPLRADGMGYYIGALLRRGERGKAGKILNEWWTHASLTAAEQSRFLKNFGSLIGKDSNIARMGKELSRKRYTNARTLARLLGNGYPALADARIALAEGKVGVDAAIARVPSHLQDDSGLLLERLKWRRRHGRDFGVLEILHKPLPSHLVEDPDEWWEERHRVIRGFIEEKKYKDAYLLVEKHVQESGISFAEAEFLAGWLALRHMNKPWRAFEHFEALYHRTSMPISRARGAYWAGRASEGLKHPDIAMMWYKAAARHPTTFYGQLAIGKLPRSERPPEAATPVRTLDGKHEFEQREMVQIVRLLARAGMDDEAAAFLIALSHDIDKPQHFLFLADLAGETGQRHEALRIAKRALYKGVLLMDHLYPTMLSAMRDVDVEWALVHAVMRQESAFNRKARSYAGATGLMQLMPATAKETARRNDIAYRPSRLTEPEYNIRLGTLYLQQMLDRYDGYYPLALAAYNAGPGRASRWLREIGDPRKGEIDIIDWTETIPIAETRNYVQRVLESVYIYRLKFQNVQKSTHSDIHVAMTPGSDQEAVH